MPDIDILLLLIAIFGTYRLAQFITYDDAPFNLMDDFRCYLGRKVAESKMGSHGIWWSLAEWINCPFCNGLWIALLFTLILFPINLISFFIWLAIAGGQAWLESQVRARSDA